MYIMILCRFAMLLFLYCLYWLIAIVLWIFTDLRKCQAFGNKLILKVTLCLLNLYVKLQHADLHWHDIGSHSNFLLDLTVRAFRL